MALFRNRTDIFVYAVCIALGMFHFYSYMKVESYAPDSSSYIGLADAIREKGQYVFNFAPHVKYPPGFPALLALISIPFGSSYFAFVRAAAIIAMLGLMASYAMLRRLEGRGVAAAGCLILGFSAHYFFQAARMLGSDAPYFLTSILVIVLMIRVEESPNSRWRGIARGAIAVLLVVSILIRTAGAALLVGMFIWLVVSALTNRKTALARAKCFAPAGIAAALVFGGWMLWTQQAKYETKDFGGESETYVDEFWLKDSHDPELGRATLVDLLKRGSENILVHGAHISEIILRIPWVEQRLYSPLVLIPVALLLLGWVYSVIETRGDGFTEWYFATYVMMYLLWPYDVGPRFVFPVFPLVFLYLYRATAWLFRLRVWRFAAFSRGLPFLSIVLAIYAGAESVPEWRQVGIQAKASLTFWLLMSLFLLLQIKGVIKKIVDRLSFQDVAFGRRNFAQIVNITAVVVLVIIGLLQQVRGAMWNLSPPVHDYVHQPSKDAADWIVGHASSEDVVMAQQVPILYRVTGRRIVAFPVVSDAQKIMTVIEKARVRFLVVVTSTRGTNVFPTEIQRAEMLQKAFPGEIKLVHSDESFRIYELGRLGATPAQRRERTRL